jgi:hypothetical protein
MEKLEKAIKKMKRLAKYQGQTMASTGIETAIGAGPSMMEMSQTARLKKMLEGWRPSQRKEE